METKGTGVAVSPRLLPSAHSQVLSRLCSTWRLLAAGFPPWPGPPLLRQPGHPGLPQGAHVDAEHSTDTQSTWAAGQRDSQPHTILCSRPPVTGLQEHATAPSRQLFSPHCHIY
ncbi:hypothetical protein PR048_026292 [Dryococelus australis]|uniref:Uncharacterized protein n=1 Tax=Dryococelus australis TaxID=614101 RepID=A0ABQ9GKZ2_9NEOP|nr:hypothetical protein PR048_026292 [Dryococelus australis]